MINLSELNQFLPWFSVFGMMLIAWRALSIAELAIQAKPQVGVVPQPTAPTPVQTPPVAKPELSTPKTCPSTPAPDVIIDQGLVDFIKREEGFEPKATWDYKQWTNGYGTKAKSSTEVITEAEAETRLRAEIAVADAFVTKRFPNLPKGQHQALIDLTFNAGSGWEDQSLGRAVAEQKIDTIKADIVQYVHAGKPPVVLEDLVKRRAAEVAMIDHPL